MHSIVMKSVLGALAGGSLILAAGVQPALAGDKYSNVKAVADCLQGADGSITVNASLEQKPTVGTVVPTVSRVDYTLERKVGGKYQAFLPVVTISFEPPLLVPLDPAVPGDREQFDDHLFTNAEICGALGAGVTASVRPVIRVFVANDNPTNREPLVSRCLAIPVVCAP